MAARRKTTRGNSGQHSPSLSPAISLIGITVGIGLTLFAHFPGAIVAWLFITVAAWLNPRAEMTGKKDSNGYPTPAHGGEEKALRRYRFWSDLKWRMFSPNLDWWVGWPVYASTFIAVWVAATAYYFDDLIGPVSAAFAYITVAQVAAARRRNSPLGEPCPGVTVGPIKDFGKHTMAMSWRLLAGAAVGGAVLYALTYVPVVNVHFGAAGWILATTGGALFAIQRWWSTASLAKWRELVAARKEWKPRWEMLKQDPAPYVVARDHLGEVVVDTFDAPGNLGAIAFYGMAPKIVPTIGTNTMLFILPTENLDEDGQPIAGTQHPLRFRVVTMTQDGMPDLTDMNTSEDEVRIALECAVVGTLMEMGAAAPFIGQITNVVDTDAGVDDMDVSLEDDDADYTGLPPDVAEAMQAERLANAPAAQNQPAHQQPKYAAWAVEILVPNGPPLKWLHTDATGQIASRLGCEVIVDWRNYERMFVGNLTDPDQTFVDYSQQVQSSKRLKDLPTTFNNIATESEWMERWEGVLKTTVNFPAIEHDQYFEYTLKDGTTVYSQSFVTLKGDELALYFNNETKLATALEHKPFVATVGFLMKSQRRGERHPQAFTVLWSDGNVPSSPDKLQPPGRSGTPTAEICVLRGRVNEAFKAARLAQPEVFDAKCLTAPRSRGHIWKIHVRLYGGVTLADVRTATQRLKQSWGCPWLRVTESPNGDGIIIVAGANPTYVNPADETVKPYLTSLDWEQAWLDAKISGVGGTVPKLKKVDALPDNDIVAVLDFQLPSGLSLGDVKAVRTKLESTTANAYVEVRPHPNNNPSEIQLYVAKESPMPRMINFDFDFADTSDRGLPFGTGIEGRPMCLNLREIPHLLLAGTSGGGKSVTAQGIMYGALVQGAQVVMIDVQKRGADFKFAEHHAAAFVTNIFEAEAVMKAVYAEVKRRAAANGDAGVGHSSELPDAPPPIVVFIDEFLGVIMSGTKPGNKPEEDPEIEAQRLENVRLYNAKKQIAFLTGRIAAEARSADVHMVLMTQKLVMAMLDDDLKDLKTNMARILLGKTNSGERMSALRDAEAAPPLGNDVPKGRGIWESTMEVAQMAQFWYAPASEYGENLEQRLPPISDDLKIDFTPFMAKPDANKSAIFGQRIEKEPKAKRVAQDETIDLGALDFDLDLEDEAEDGEVDLAALGIQIIGDDDDEEATETSAPSDDMGGLNWGDFTPAPDSDDDPFADVPFVPEVVSDPFADFDITAGATADEDEEEDDPAWLDLDVADLTFVTDEDSMFGWGVLDTVAAYLDEHPEVRVVSWSDPLLHTLDEYGTGREQLLREVTASMGVEFSNTAAPPYRPEHRASDRTEAPQEPAEDVQTPPVGNGEAQAFEAVQEPAFEPFEDAPKAPPVFDEPKPAAPVQQDRFESFDDEPTAPEPDKPKAYTPKPMTDDRFGEFDF
jgi:S-DNA-T family DNA segregation ATPase FtsK/SpoIIIE